MTKKTIKHQQKNENSEDTIDPIDDKLSEEISLETEKEPLQELTIKLEAKEKEAKETHDRLLRVSAEFDNYKKRSLKEIADFKKFANESLIKELLPIIDNFERALDSIKKEKKESDPLLQGVEMILDGILNALENFGVKQIACLKETFDPTFHQAISREETDKHPENIITQECQKGYTLHERLLRPAMVVVSATKAEDIE